MFTETTSHDEVQAKDTLLSNILKAKELLDVVEESKRQNIQLQTWSISCQACGLQFLSKKKKTVHKKSG